MGQQVIQQDVNPVRRQKRPTRRRRQNGVEHDRTGHAPEHLRGIGVRIEDDILITSDGVENLTRSCPKTLQELEELVGSASA